MNIQTDIKKLTIRLKKKEITLSTDVYKHLKCEVLEIISESLAELDPRIIELKNLRILSITSKKLKTIPKEIFELEKLQILKIKNGQLENIPHLEKPKCIGLTNLMISNQFLKEIPSWFLKFTNIETLDLSGNQLTSLSEDLKNMSKLKRLNLDKNKFSNMPTVLTKLKGLNHLSMDHNPLSEEAKNQIFKHFKIWF